MSQSSSRLSLPYIQPAQAQKHVTHNESLRLLDTLVHLSFTAMGTEIPPADPGEGECHALGAAPSGLWSGHAGEVATWSDAAWTFLVPRTGWVATRDGTAELYVFDGSAWQGANVSVVTDNLDGVGIGTSSDPVNRLAVASEAVLFSHAGGGHQMKVNKASASETASLLFQSNWSGRAEMGLAGDDAFSIKVSADGTAWDTALSLSPGMGVVTTDTMVGPVSQTPGPGAGVVESGTTVDGSFTKFADGTLICFTESFATASGAAAGWTFPAAFASSAVAVTTTVLGPLPGVVTIDALTATSASLRSFDLAGAESFAPQVMLHAVGRWF